MVLLSGEMSNHRTLTSGSRCPETLSWAPGKNYLVLKKFINEREKRENPERHSGTCDIGHKNPDPQT